MRVLLTVIAAILYALGWATGKLWLPVAWSATAVLIGFREATAPKAPARRVETGVPLRPAA